MSRTRSVIVIRSRPAVIDRRTYRSRSVFLLGLVALLLVACGGGNQPSAVQWRNATVQLPDGWYVFEEEPTRLSISNRDIGPEAVAGETDVEGETVAMWFTYEPTTLPADWRRLIDERGWTIESDRQVELPGEVPATMLVFSFESLGVRTREMVTLVPSRGFVILSQPIPGPGDDDVSDVYLSYADEFVGVLETMQLGSPVLD
jgi:hypothetical protein